MNKRMLLVGSAAGVVGFLVGWVLLGMLFTRYYESHAVRYTEMIRPAAEVNLMGLFVAALLFGLILGWAGWRMGVSSFSTGTATGGIIGFLAYASTELFFFPMVNMFASTDILVGDLLANTLWAACMGGLAGLMLLKSSNRYRGNVAVYQ